MNKSEQINELADALSKLQGQIKDAVKDTKAYGHMYAELTQMFDIARPLLQKTGLSISQLPYNKDEKVGVETILMHSSGQFLSSCIEMPLIDGKGMNTAQKVGSVISYIRKYSYMAILGFTQKGEDDDAQAIEEKPRFEQAKPKAIPTKAAEMPKWNLTQELFDNLFDMLNKAGYTEQRVLDRFNIRDIKTLNEEQYTKTIKACTMAIEQKEGKKK